MENTHSIWVFQRMSFDRDSPYQLNDFFGRVQQASAGYIVVFPQGYSQTVEYDGPHLTCRQPVLTQKLGLLSMQDINQAASQTLKDEETS